MGTNEVFVSYARSDRSVLKGLFDSLKVVQQHHSVGVWDDSKIPAGADWRQEIENQMSAARIAILAVSPAFLSSDFITRVELPKLLGQAKLKGTLACVIHVRPAPFDLVESLERLQAINDPKQTVVELRAPERERFWAKVARFVRDQLATGNSRHE